MPLTPGTRLGPYEILAPIGAGGMGEVWRARDTRLDRIVAIKQLKGQHTVRFQQEAKAIAALNHPNICQIHDVGPDYLVLEYIDGAPIRGPLPAKEALRLGMQILSAIEAAHKRGILHRDLKPANILVNDSGAKLLDFGLAKLTGDENATQTLGIAGTPVYMSPEQAEGKTLDARSDIFSFGTVLYELLTGRRAFESLAAVLRDEPATLETAPTLSNVVERCLKKSPGDRFANAADVRAALEEAAAHTGEAQPSIAVLPFANMSRDTDDEYFSDGLAEEIINELVKIPGLKVVARTSAFAFKGQNIDIRKIAATLGVAHILEGSVRRSGNRIRVTGQLITAADGSHLWSERYDRELADVFAVQDEISAAIVAALRPKLSPQAAASPRYTPKLAAHEALLKARYFHWKVTRESMEQAKGFYEQAIVLDPQYALAHAFYADFQIGRALMELTPSREAAPKAKALASRALELDPALPEAHSILCLLAANFDYDWQEALRQSQLTTSQGSLSPSCRMNFGRFCLPALGQWREAVEQNELAVQGDPLHVNIRTSLAISLSAIGRHAEAEQEIRQAIDLDPHHLFAHANGAFIYLAAGKPVEALALAEKAASWAPWYPSGVGVYAAALALTGEQARGRELVEKLDKPLAFFHFYLACGELGLAADWIEKAIEERELRVPVLLQHPASKPLRDSPRWTRLASMLKLPS